MIDVLSPADFLGAAKASPGDTLDPNAFMGISPAPKQKAAAAEPASTLGYVGSRFLGGLLEGGRNIAAANSLEMGQPEQAQEFQSMPSGQESADKAIYGTTNVQAPNTIARYAGAVASGAGQNPVLTAIAPGYSAASSLGSEGGSDINSATGSYLPDWLASLLGGIAGGGLYGGGKALAGKAAGALTGDRPVENGRDIMARVQAGEGRIGEFQKQAEQTASTLQQASADMPQVPAIHLVPMSATKEFVESPASALIPGVDRIQKAIEANGGSLPYGQLESLKDAVGAAGQSGLYNALKADQRAAIVAIHGDGASAAFDKANAARQALYVLNKSVDPSGLYNPLALTRKLAVHPGAGTVADATPEMTGLTNRASDLYNMVSPLTKANMPRPGLLRRAVPAAVGIAAEKMGVPGGELAAGWILGHGNEAPPNPLYKLPSRPFGTGPYAGLLAGPGVSVLNPNQPNGLLSP